jgi:hypothetical protein
MRARTYQLTVIGTILAAFLTGTHMPVLHEIIEHGAAAHWDVLIATLVLIVFTVAGGWTLLRAASVVTRVPRA